MCSRSSDNCCGRNKRNIRALKSRGSGGRCCLGMVARAGLGGELIFESRPEGGEEVSHVDSGEMTIPRSRNSQVQRS